MWVFAAVFAAVLLLVILEKRFGAQTARCAVLVALCSCGGAAARLSVALRLPFRSACLCGAIASARVCCISPYPHR